MSSATVGSAVVIEHTTPAKSREWWRRESARLGSDWNGVMELRASVAPLTRHVYGSAPCVNPSFCAACRLADQQRRRPSQSERVQLSSTQLTYWAACRVGEMVASGLLDAHAVAAVITEAATRVGLSHSEAKRTAWGGIRGAGGVHA